MHFCHLPPHINNYKTSFILYPIPALLVNRLLTHWSFCLSLPSPPVSIYPSLCYGLSPCVCVRSKREGRQVKGEAMHEGRTKKAWDHWALGTMFSVRIWCCEICIHTFISLCLSLRLYVCLSEKCVCVRTWGTWPQSVNHGGGSFMIPWPKLFRKLCQTLSPSSLLSHAPSLFSQLSCSFPDSVLHSPIFTALPLSVSVWIRSTFALISFQPCLVSISIFFFRLSALQLCSFLTFCVFFSSGYFPFFSCCLIIFFSH